MALDKMLKRREMVGSLGALDFLIQREKKNNNKFPDVYKKNYIPFDCQEIEIEGDKSRFLRPPSNFPNDLVLPELIGLGNDYSHLENFLIPSDNVGVSIIVLTFNRAIPLSRTLAGIVNQSYPLDCIEVIVTDDGGQEDTLSVVKEFSDKLNIRYVWHRDVGFTPAAARNNGIQVARNDFIILLDVDMYPSRDLVKNYVKWQSVKEKAVFVGPRKYTDLSKFNYKEILGNVDIENDFDEIVTNNNVANKISGSVSIDWRLEIFDKTNNLKQEKIPFRIFASGNVAFSRSKFLEVGKFEERFTSWGYEDVELGFRFFNHGLYVIPIRDAWAYHQEPENGNNETDRAAGKINSGELFGQLCPHYRKLTSKKQDFEVPTVSIYIPAFNAEKTICDAIDSALNQSYKDLEVCICDDGSTDSTRVLIERYFGSNPRVRWTSQLNGGIGKASNTAVGMARGLYIGQLDSDDYLARDVVERCLSVMEKDPQIGLVYTSYENEYPDGRIEPGYNYPVFTREKMMTAMIAHHFRFFRKLYWHRTEKFSESIKNAVDYDFYLKLVEICDVKHLNIRGYRRRLHGENTSIVDFSAQVKNAKIVVNNSLRRQGVKYKAELVNENSPGFKFLNI